MSTSNSQIERIRALVRAELIARLGRQPHPGRVHPAEWIVHDDHFQDEPDFDRPRSCLIEPHRLCCNSGYCKKLGH